MTCPDCHMKFPTEEDLDWMMIAVQRHTGGMKGWWEEYKDQLGPREIARIFITAWEAGRVPGEDKSEWNGEKDPCDPVANYQSRAKHELIKEA